MRILALAFLLSLVVSVSLTTAGDDDFQLGTWVQSSVASVDKRELYTALSVPIREKGTK